MVLETIQATKAHTLAGKPDGLSPRRQRIISESTGLVKFNIKRKAFEEKDHANKEFADLEAEAHGKTLTKKPSRATLSHKSSLLQLSPQRPKAMTQSPSPSPQKHENNEIGTRMGHMDEDLMLRLASKQREVLELKTNMDELKRRLHRAESELHEIQAKCNQSTVSNSKMPQGSPRRQQGKPLDQFTTLRAKPSIQTLKASIESHTTTTNNNIQTLKNKISVSQLKTRASLLQLSENANLQKFQKDTNNMIERGLSFVNSIKQEMFLREEDNEHSDDESDMSDYGCADTSNYQLAVK